MLNLHLVYKKIYTRKAWLPMASFVNRNEIHAKIIFKLNNAITKLVKKKEILRVQLVKSNRDSNFIVENYT